MAESSLIVPAYNEEDVIEDTLTHLDKISCYFEEVYLMDDASTDSTQERIHNYLQDHDSDVKVAYMREKQDKIGAIEEAVRHIDSETVFLTDADTRLVTPEEVEAAEKYVQENDYGAVSFAVRPGESAGEAIDKMWNKLQDFDYAMGRALTDYTTGDKLRLDSEDKNVRCIAGAGGMYKTEVLENALEHHSGRHAGDDIETTLITQQILDEDINYFNEVELETNVPKEYPELLKQRTRWAEGAIQSFSEHPRQHLNEIKSLSRYGQVMAYEAGITAAAPVMLGKAALEASQGDLSQAAESFKYWYGIDTVFTGLIGAYSIRKESLTTRKQ
ncbi:MAG: glycosyltransferase involved in cell wall biogenesis [Candidatus Nanosalina sp. J07AB43]|nr:MAG: glycosyltransferase involved in cell wall biogenesis [Candidatus Nanosalina sp. J07AB43]